LQGIFEKPAIFSQTVANSIPMKPQKSPNSQPSQFQLFQTRLEQLVDARHELIQLAELIQWSRFDEAYEPLYCEDNGAPGLPTRLMVGLEYLKYTFNLSDEELVKRWVENPYWQYFCGEVFFQTEPPLHPTSLGVWRRRIGEEKLKLILEETGRVAMKKKYLTEIRIARSSNVGLSQSERKRKRRRSSIEPVIGHLKSDHRLDRCFLKGRLGDKLNLIGSASGFNVRKLLRLLSLGSFPCVCWFWGDFGRFFGLARRSFADFCSACAPTPRDWTIAKT
jgi:IS5 family transposase